ncbi:hypothetical protein ACU7M0_36640, partial [Burkholderia cenocepacia]
FVFNGMVFIMLGLQLPHIIVRALVYAHHTSDAMVGRMIFNACAPMRALHAIRFLRLRLLRPFACRRPPRPVLPAPLPCLLRIPVLPLRAASRAGGVVRAGGCARRAARGNMHAARSALAQGSAGRNVLSAACHTPRTQRTLHPACCPLYTTDASDNLIRVTLVTRHLMKK